MRTGRRDDTPQTSPSNFQLSNSINRSHLHLQFFPNRTGRLIYGKNKVVSKALGTSPETSYKPELYQLSSLLRGQVGIFLTSHPIPETIDWFQSYTRPSFSRQHTRSTMDLTLPAGPILNFEGEKFQHSMEVQLRGCGLPGTYLEKGVPSLKEETVVVRKGEKLSGEKARLMMMLGYMMAVSGRPDFSGAPVLLFGTSSFATAHSFLLALSIPCLLPI